MKHIERLHKNVSALSTKPDIAKITHAPVSSALPNVSSADSSPLRPGVRVTVPLQREPVVGLQDKPTIKTVTANVSYSTDGDLDHLSLVNVHTQQSRALTVSLPDDVTIPAGCTVELVEVKTVNGTKELKLRFVSKQEKSAIKDSKNTVPQSTLLEKPITSTLSPQISAVKSGGLGSSNRQLCETQTLNVERHAAVPVSIFKRFPNQVNTERSGHKRALPYVIELDSPVPSKNTKIQIKSKRGRASVGLDAPGEHTHLKAALSSVSFNRLNQTVHADKRETSICPPVRAEQEKKSLLSQPSQSVPLQSERDANSSTTRKDPEIVKFRKRTDSEFIKDAAELSQQTLKSTPLSLSVPSTSPSAQVRHPLVSVSKNSGVENQSFPEFKTLTQLLAKTDVADCVNKNGSGWRPTIKSEDRAGGGDKKEPESFPVISSVFSLSSQQPNQPLVTSLCGMVMNKSSDVSSDDHVKSINGTEKSLEAPTPRLPQISLKEEPNICKPLSTEGLVDFVKEEKKDTNIQQDKPLMDQNAHIKEEKRNSQNSQTDSEPKCFSNPPLNKKAEPESSPKTVELVDVSVCTDGLQQFVKYESGISSKFLTVSLKRVEVAVWEKSNTRNFMATVTDCEALSLMPLKVDQLVKRPGPDQPVVVLNHPKPRAPEQVSRTDTIRTTDSSFVVPKCQILKMRLGKVMGQKYEVKGCTVRNLP